MDDLPPFPKVKETKVKTYPKSAAKIYACVAIKDAPNHPAYRPMDKEFSLPNTYYLVERATRIPVAYMTMMPDGLCVAWSACRRCHRGGRRCVCQQGVMVDRSIEYIYDKTVAMINGEEWNYLHPNYRGSLTGKDEERRRRAWERRSRGGQTIKPAEPSKPASRASKAPLRKASAKPKVSHATALTPAKRPRRVAEPVEDTAADILQGGRISHAKLDQAAHDSAEELSRKLLSKSTTPAKKIIKRRK